MDITGKIIYCFEPRSGQSTRTGNPWKSQDFVIEWYDGNYHRHCCFNVFGEENLKKFNIQQGQEYTVSVDVDAHVYNGRWFNDIRARNVVPPADAPANQEETASASAPATPVMPAAEVPAPTAPAPSPEQAPEDDLPF